jgi:hypothetical protein
MEGQTTLDCTGLRNEPLVRSPRQLNYLTILKRPSLTGIIFAPNHSADRTVNPRDQCRTNAVRALLQSFTPRAGE